MKNQAFLLKFNQNNTWKQQVNITDKQKININIINPQQTNNVTIDYEPSVYATLIEPRSTGQLFFIYSVVTNNYIRKFVLWVKHCLRNFESDTIELTLSSLLECSDNEIACNIFNKPMQSFLNNKDDPFIFGGVAANANNTPFTASNWLASVLRSSPWFKMGASENDYSSGVQTKIMFADYNDYSYLTINDYEKLMSPIITEQELNKLFDSLRYPHMQKFILYFCETFNVFLDFTTNDDDSQIICLVRPIGKLNKLICNDEPGFKIISFEFSPNYDYDRCQKIGIFENVTLRDGYFYIKTGYVNGDTPYNSYNSLHYNDNAQLNLYENGSFEILGDTQHTYNNILAGETQENVDKRLEEVAKNINELRHKTWEQSIKEKRVWKIEINFSSLNFKLWPGDAIEISYVDKDKNIVNDVLVVENVDILAENTATYEIGSLNYGLTKVDKSENLVKGREK